MLDRRQFLVKERIAFLKLTDTWDIHDPASGAKIGEAREVISPLAKLARLIINKRLLPTRVEVTTGVAGPPVLVMTRGVTLLHANVLVLDGQSREIGRFRSRILTIGGGFDVFDTAGFSVAEIKGDWKGWNFRFLGAGGEELGTVTKKWAGLGQEFFTSADNYMIALNETRALPPDTAALLLAAGLAIDIVFKEKN